MRHGATLADGRPLTPDLIHTFAEEELAKIRRSLGDERFRLGRFEEARRLFERVAHSPDFQEFLVIPAYDLID